MLLNIPGAIRAEVVFTMHYRQYPFFYIYCIRILFFTAQAESSYFFADCRLKIFAAQRAKRASNNIVRI